MRHWGRSVSDPSRSLLVNPDRMKLIESKLARYFYYRANWLKEWLAAREATVRHPNLDHKHGRPIIIGWLYSPGIQYIFEAIEGSRKVTSLSPKRAGILSFLLRCRFDLARSISSLFYCCYAARTRCLFHPIRHRVICLIFFPNSSRPSSCISVGFVNSLHSLLWYQGKQNAP